jgi:hypothetical protein
MGTVHILATAWRESAVQLEAAKVSPSLLNFSGIYMYHVLSRTETLHFAHDVNVTPFL